MLPQLSAKGKHRKAFPSGRSAGTAIFLVFLTPLIPA